MTDFAKDIEITDSGIKINGQDFPWYIAEGGVSLSSEEGPETLTLTLLTGRVGAAAPGDEPGRKTCTESPDASTPGPSLEDTIDQIGRRLAKLKSDPVGPLARAEAARDQAEEQLSNAHEALEDNYTTMERLRSDLAQTERALKASQSTVCGLAEDLSEAQHRARKLEDDTDSHGKPKAPRKDSMLDAAKLSLKEAERLEAQGQRQAEECRTTPRTSFEAMRDELLLANAQASIAVAEALASPTSTEQLTVDQEPESAGHKIGTAYVEVRPDFSAFEGEEFKSAVDKAVRGALSRL